jgi:hypothetical protein
MGAMSDERSGSAVKVSVPLFAFQPILGRLRFRLGIGFGIGFGGSNLEMIIAGFQVGRQIEFFWSIFFEVNCSV